jgi:hypothetical protein
MAGLTSLRTLEYEESLLIKHRQFDTGAACENFALEASIRAIFTNGVKDFDYEKITRDLEIPDMYYIMLLRQ